MNSISLLHKKRNPPLVTWADKIAQAKRRVALLNLLVDEGSCPVVFCRAHIPSLTKDDIQEMIALKWIGAFALDGALYIRDAGKALLAGEQ